MSKIRILPRLKNKLRIYKNHPELFSSKEEREITLASLKACIGKERERLGNDTGITPLYLRRL